MIDHRPGPAAVPATAAAPDSHAATPKPSRKAALPEGTNQGRSRLRKALDVPGEVPLHLKPVLNGYAEVAAVGICSERAMRRHLATGRVSRCVIRNGRNLRFVKDILIAELLGAER